MEFKDITVTKKAISFLIYLKNVEDLIYDLVKADIKNYNLNFKIEDEGYYMTLKGIIEYREDNKDQIVNIIKDNEILE
jgi:hypothetical protein